MLGSVRRVVDEARLRGRRLRGNRTTCEDVWLTLPDGYRISGHVHTPPGSGSLPAVLLVPGLAGTGTSFDHLGAIVSVSEITSLGCVCVHFDPPGLGRSWGDYDFGGPACYTATLAALELLSRHPRHDGGRLGVLAISLAVASAVRVVADHGVRLGVDWLLDWEGPGDRQIVTSFGTIMKPAMGHGLDDEAYWQPREAVRHVGRLRCRYVREQSSVDHAQGEYTTHATDMVNAALAGGCPDVWLNGRHLTRPVGPSASVSWRDPGRCQAAQTLQDVVREQLARH